MKKSINKISLVAITSLLIIGTSLHETRGQSQIVNTIIQNGVLFPMVELSEVQVSAKGFKKQNSDQTTSQLALTYSAKLVKIEKHSGEYMPSVLLDDAIVIADKPQVTSASGINKALQFVIVFIANYVSHYGIIQ